MDQSLGGEKAQVLLVDDSPENLKVLRRLLEAQGYEVAIATDGARTLELAQTQRELRRELATKNEALEKANQALVESNSRLKYALEKWEQSEAARAQSEARLEDVSDRENLLWDVAGICGESETLKHILKQVEQLQGTDSTSVLIVGESGTGKELVARAIHFGGLRAGRSFVPVNCSAIPAELMEASFFGHERGAFTGAERSRTGYFEQADGGTLFLDEIGDMPVDLQAKLLRVLEDGMVLPVGSTEARQVDVRILSATHANLHERIEARLFREDLYYRLARVTVAVPPLRERAEDIVVLADHFLAIFAAEMGVPTPQLSTDALAALRQHDFPGNVRQLKNMMESALIQSGGATIMPGHLHWHNGGAEIAVDRSSSAYHPIAPDFDVQAEAVLAFVKLHGSINNLACRNLLHVERRRAAYVLEKLCEAGELVQVGSRRWTRYQLA